MDGYILDSFDIKKIENGFIVSCSYDPIKEDKDKPYDYENKQSFYPEIEGVIEKVRREFA